MDPMNVSRKLGAFFCQYKYVIMVVVIGLLLMAIPNQSENGSSDVQIAVDSESDGIQRQLEEILGQIDGVGRVKVLLTLSEGERILYESNEDRILSDQSNSQRQDTVIILDENRSESGLIQQIIPPVYLGAVIVCQGGDKPSVKLAVVEAVSNATGLSADRVSVMKMK